VAEQRYPAVDGCDRGRIVGVAGRRESGGVAAAAAYVAGRHEAQGLDGLMDRHCHTSSKARPPYRRSGSSLQVVADSRRSAGHPQGVRQGHRLRPRAFTISRAIHKPAAPW